MINESKLIDHIIYCIENGLTEEQLNTILEECEEELDMTYDDFKRVF